MKKHLLSLSAAAVISLGSLTLAASLPALAQAVEKQVAPLDLVAPVAEYKIYVSKLTQQFARDTKAFTDAVKAGDVEKAKALYAPTRVSYEKIEPIAELFSDLDAAIDSRADDHEKAEADPEFGGFHRIEHGLWVKNSTEGLAEYADKLQADVEELNKRIVGLTFPPEKVVGGAAVLMEEVAATKISGEENRYSLKDLWDFQANFDGARKVFDLFKPLLVNEDVFIAKVDGNFDRVYATLSRYKDGDGFQDYDKLTDADRRVLAGAVNTLAEDLSTLRGKLGLE